MNIVITKQGGQENKYINNEPIKVTGHLLHTTVTYNCYPNNCYTQQLHTTATSDY